MKIYQKSVELFRRRRHLVFVAQVRTIINNIGPVSLTLVQHGPHSEGSFQKALKISNKPNEDYDGRKQRKTEGAMIWLCLSIDDRRGIGASR